MITFSNPPRHVLKPLVVNGQVVDAVPISMHVPRDHVHDYPSVMPIFWSPFSTLLGRFQPAFLMSATDIKKKAGLVTPFLINGHFIRVQYTAQCGDKIMEEPCYDMGFVPGYVVAQEQIVRTLETYCEKADQVSALGTSGLSDNPYPELLRDLGLKGVSPVSVEDENASGLIIHPSSWMFNLAGRYVVEYEALFHAPGWWNHSVRDYIRMNRALLAESRANQTTMSCDIETGGTLIPQANALHFQAMQKMGVEFLTYPTGTCHVPESTEVINDRVSVSAGRALCLRFQGFAR